MKFNAAPPLNTYAKVNGGSFSVPFQASYVQVNEKVTAGTVNGAMLMLLNYQ